jgi:ribosome-associated translation inhibitor RaiA
MKLTVQHMCLRSTDELDSLVEDRIFALEPKLRIDEARVSLEHWRGESPAYRVALHLVTPGPDVLAEARDHTIRAAIEKAIAEVNHKIKYRALKPVRRIRSHAQRSGRAASSSMMAASAH